jgi:hypothetical protein
VDADDDFEGHDLARWFSNGADELDVAFKASHCVACMEDKLDLWNVKYSLVANELMKDTFWKVFVTIFDDELDLT